MVHSGLQNVGCRRTGRIVVGHFARNIRVAVGADGSNVADAAIGRVKQGKVSANCVSRALHHLRVPLLHLAE